jgi:hypothetical protein
MQNNGFIEIEMGGELRQLKFNMVGVNAALQTIDYSNYLASANYAYIWGGLIGHHYSIHRNTDKFHLEFAVVCDWVDELNDEQMAAINECLLNASAYKKVLQATEKAVAELSDEEKKSQP